MAERGESGSEAGPAPIRAFWSGTITFGLVSIPVDLLAANRPRRVALRMLDEDGTPLRREYFCPREEVAVPGDEIARGFDLGGGEYVLLSDEELEAIEPRRSRDIDLRRFVDRAEISPLLFQRAYFLAPASESTKAYRLLVDIMERTGRAGIATFVMRGKEYLVAILAEGGVLRAETLRFADQVRSAEDLGLPEPGAAEPAQVRGVEREIEALTAPGLAPDELRDRQAERLVGLALAKRARGEGVVVAPQPVEDEEEEGGVAIDIMQVLKERMGALPAEVAPARSGDPLEGRSRKELYERARALGIPGRSRMSRDELIAAIRRAG